MKYLLCFSSIASRTKWNLCLYFVAFNQLNKSELIFDSTKAFVINVRTLIKSQIEFSKEIENARFDSIRFVYALFLRAKKKRIIFYCSRIYLQNLEGELERTFVVCKWANESDFFFICRVLNSLYDLKSKNFLIKHFHNVENFQCSLKVCLSNRNCEWQNEKRKKNAVWHITYTAKWKLFELG